MRKAAKKRIIIRPGRLKQKKLIKPPFIEFDFHKKIVVISWEDVGPGKILQIVKKLRKLDSDIIFFWCTR